MTPTKAKTPAGEIAEAFYGEPPYQGFSVNGIASPLKVKEARRSTPAPFSVGQPVTYADGTPARPGMAFNPPYWVSDGGFIVADYGNDRAAANAHFNRIMARIWGGQTRRVDVPGVAL